MDREEATTRQKLSDFFHNKLTEQALSALFKDMREVDTVPDFRISEYIDDGVIIFDDKVDMFFLNKNTEKAIYKSEYVNNSGEFLCVLIALKKKQLKDKKSDTTSS